MTKKLTKYCLLTSSYTFNMKLMPFVFAISYK